MKAAFVLLLALIIISSCTKQPMINGSAYEVKQPITDTLSMFHPVIGQ